MRLLSIINKIVKRSKLTLAVMQASKSNKSRLKCTDINNILVLCYGNIYRSPFVEKLLVTELEKTKKFSIKSAGFYYKINRPSPEHHKTYVMKNYNVDLKDHKSKLIDKKLVDWADLIIIMDKNNWYHLSDFGISATTKALWLGKLENDSNLEIEDPYGKSSMEYESIIKKLFITSKILCNHLTESV